ncbi:MAG TPA: serine hydrolase domain-containing protein [Thermoanaerobaculia bacterium]|nr:serine hydrolase domain-containing protein [Thermoanaerobaculia bacterium]
MKRRLLMLAVPLLLVPMFASSAVVPSARELEKKIDAYVAPLVAANAYSGVVFVAKGDTVLFEKAWGMANVEFSVPNKPDTRFGIASITKLFTRSILQRLFEEKKLSPDDLLAKWVPDFPAADKITIDHLSHHRSGIRDPEDLRGIVRRSYTSAEAVDRIKAHPLGSEPGKEYSYTTANYAVLAHIIERVTGKTYAEVIRQMIYEPAGMRDSGELTTATVVPRLATGYMPDPFGGLAVCGPEDASWKVGGGSSYSTPRDLHRFIRAYYANRFFATRDFASVFPETKVQERRAVTASGSYPGASANLIHIPEEGMTIVVLSNNYATVPGMIARDVAAMVYGAPYQNPIAPVAVRGKVPEANIAGRYTVADKPWKANIEMRQGKPVLLWNDVRRSALIRIAEDTWFSPLDWSKFRFTFDANGKVTGAQFLYQSDDEPMAMMRSE